MKCLQADEKGGGGPPDILSQPAMHNAYFICHNVQVLLGEELNNLYFRKIGTSYVIKTLISLVRLQLEPDYPARTETRFGFLNSTSS